MQKKKPRDQFKEDINRLEEILKTNGATLENTLVKFERNMIVFYTRPEIPKTFPLERALREWWFVERKKFSNYQKILVLNGFEPEDEDKVESLAELKKEVEKEKLEKLNEAIKKGDIPPHSSETVEIGNLKRTKPIEIAKEEGEMKSISQVFIDFNELMKGFRASRDSVTSIATEEFGKSDFKDR